MKKYLNLFWALLATGVLLNEFVFNQIDFSVIFNKQISTWVLITLWVLVAVRNYYSFFSSKNKLQVNQK